MASVTATINAGQSLSAAANVTGVISAIATPPNWVNANMTFQISPDNGVTWFDLFDNFSREVMVNVKAGTIVTVDATSPLSQKAFIKIRSGSRDSPVIQPVTVGVQIASN